MRKILGLSVELNIRIIVRFHSFHQISADFFPQIQNEWLSKKKAKQRSLHALFFKIIIGPKSSRLPVFCVFVRNLC